MTGQMKRRQKLSLYKEHAMDLFFYVLFAVVIIGTIYFIVRGKRT
jgi:hypothetical protein